MGGGGWLLPDLYVCLPAFLNMPSFLVSPVLARMTISECHLMAFFFFLAAGTCHGATHA